MNGRVKGAATPEGALAADAAGVPGKTATVIPAGRVIPADGALSKIERAVRELQEIKRLNDAMGMQFAAGSAAYQQCIAIDEHLFNALSALGE